MPLMTIEEYRVAATLCDITTKVDVGDWNIIVPASVFTFERLTPGTWCIRFQEPIFNCASNGYGPNAAFVPELLKDRICSDYRNINNVIMNSVSPIHQSILALRAYHHANRMVLSFRTDSDKVTTVLKCDSPKNIWFKFKSCHVKYGDSILINHSSATLKRIELNYSAYSI